MIVPIVTYERLQLVTWRTPTDQKHWENEYRQLVELYRTGPFAIESISTVAGRQYLVLKDADGILQDRHGHPEIFSASWVKRAT
jgi:hypothetical protein